jgi:hypothetical protein
MLAGALLATSSACAQPISIDPATVAEATSHLGLIYEQINGTPKQRRAGELVQYHLYQDAIVQCMKEKGFSYTPPPFVDIYAGLTDLRGLSGTWFAETSETSLGVADSAVRLAPLDAKTSNPGFNQLEPKDQKLYDDALTGCAPTNTPDVYIPVSSSKQDDKLLDLLSKIEEKREVAKAISAYRSCMKDHKLTVDNPDHLIEQLQQKFSNVPHEAIGKPDRPEWVAAVQEERAAAADAKCRKPVRELSAMFISTELAQFEADNRAGIQQAQDDWDDLVKQAGKYPEAAALGLR